jgi:predicted O-methyltransferase YrrM
MVQLTIDIERINKFNFNSLRSAVFWENSAHKYDAKSLFYPAGHQHYQLLATIASSCPDDTKFLEIGTRIGISSLAIHQGSGGGNRISLTTCDLEDNIPEGKSVKAFPDIKFLVKDGFELLGSDQSWDIIFIDVDPHDGVQERRMINKLIEIDFKGIVILDDIHLNAEMQALWDWIPVRRKVDLTKFGHNSGTGVVLFGDSKLMGSVGDSNVFDFEGNVDIQK